MGIVEELYLFDRENAWNNVFQKVKHESLQQHKYPLKESRRPEYKSRNRYGDVSPYDHSRITLHKDDLNYINASLVQAEQANRAYILTQGPLPDTVSHFWLMVWEQGSEAILMLNNMIEKGCIKCHQYFPTSDSPSTTCMTFSDLHLKVTFIDELESNDTYVIRVFNLENTETCDSRQVLQFHYTAWPDFGVPESPFTFLNFLFLVRKFGYLDDPAKPPIIHCSAGIGRSGTFCLVDTCLLLAEKRGGVEGLCVLDELMMMRRFRMGLIQTPEQLRFTYLAIIEGAKRLNCLDHSTITSPLPGLARPDDDDDDDDEEDEVDDDDEECHDSMSSFSGSDDDDNDEEDEEDGGDGDDLENGKYKERKYIKNSLDAGDADHHNNHVVSGAGDDYDDDEADDDFSGNNKNDRNNNIRNPSTKHKSNNNNISRRTTHNANNNTAHYTTTAATDTTTTDKNNDNNKNLKDNDDNDVDNDDGNDVGRPGSSAGTDRKMEDDKQARHNERVLRMQERLQRMKENQRRCEEERERGWWRGWVDLIGGPYVVAAASVAVLAAGFMAYKAVFN